MSVDLADRPLTKDEAPTETASAKTSSAAVQATDVVPGSETRAESPEAVEDLPARHFGDQADEESPPARIVLIGKSQTPWRTGWCNETATEESHRRCTGTFRNGPKAEVRVLLCGCPTCSHQP